MVDVCARVFGVLFIWFATRAAVCLFGFGFDNLFANARRNEVDYTIM